jgi:hypothetical protein
MERDVEYLARRLGILRIETKLVEADSREGIVLTENYDLTGRPAVVLLTLDGVMIERWQGELPQAEDVSYMAHA